MPARVIAISRTSQSARVTSRYPQPLRVKVLDADGNPVAGATVTFTLASSTGAGTCAAAPGASASFIGAGAEASATTDASGVATSPLFSANSVAGPYTASATVAQAASSGPSGGAGSAGSDGATPASFALANLAGEPAKLTVGVGASQSTMIGGRFAIGLAVTVTDAEKNPVAGALVTFSAPARGASAHFTTRSRGAGAVRSHTSQRRTIVVKTDACGIAVAAPPNANHEQGGYIVRASVGRAVAAAFALVNEAPKPRL
jgi:protocatechuate 3,4-dioxygenase beta subunit